MARANSGLLRAVYALAMYSCCTLLCTRIVCGEFHCYCNLPRCASSYMCESHIGCYSLLTDQTNDDSNNPDLHGCIDSQMTTERCQAPGIHNHTSTTEAPSTMTTIAPTIGELVKVTERGRDLSCCYESMCNFEDGSKDEKDSREGVDDHYTHPIEAVSDQAMWFRAAVIAVPIAGACILTVLIMIAARMLRSDDKPFTKLGTVRDVVRVRQRALLATRTNATIAHQSPLFLGNSRVKSINITGNKLISVDAPHPKNKVNNVNKMTNVTNEFLHHQRCRNECPRLLETKPCEKMYRENFDVV